MTDQGEITRLLMAYAGGERAALDGLLPLVYDELKRVASQRLARGRPGETLDTYALVHEMFVKLAASDGLALANRDHFFAVASKAMRQIIIDRARSVRAAKRGGGAVNISLDRVPIPAPRQADELIALDRALSGLADVSERLSEVVELRYFGGLSVEQTAAALGTSARTVKRDWQKARAWLFRALEAEGYA